MKCYKWLPILFILFIAPLTLRAQPGGTDTATTLSAPDGTPVVIYRDNYGVPHVRAATEAGVFFGQGFAAAEDRLFQMETFRRAALGRQHYACCASDSRQTPAPVDGFVVRFGGVGHLVQQMRPAAGRCRPYCAVKRYGLAAP